MSSHGRTVPNTMTMIVDPFGFGLRYNAWTSFPARKPSAGAVRGPVSVLLRGWDSPAVFFEYKLLDRGNSQ
jgi:hypothetical protein